MPRRFDRKTGWNRQFKWKPLRRDRWDPFPKDHLPFIDDFSVLSYVTKARQAKAMNTNRMRDNVTTPTTLLGKRRADINTARKAQNPALTRPRTRSQTGTARNLFTNDAVANLATLGVGAGAMARTAAGIAVDTLDQRIRSGIEEGFRLHAAFNESGIPTFDALTESAMAGSRLDRMIATGERILPLVEDLLIPFML